MMFSTSMAVRNNGAISSTLNPGNATTNLCHIEFEVRKSLCKADELIHIWLNGLDTSLHRGNSITLSLQTNALTPYCTKSFVCQPCRTTAMSSSKVTAKHEYLIRFQFRYSLGCIFSVVHSFYFLDFIISSASLRILSNSP